MIRLARRSIYTIVMLGIALALTQIPVYGINQEYISYLFSSVSVLGFMDTLSGGALSNLSLGAFGITSYITASIIIQMLSAVIPALERAHRQRKKTDRATFWLSMAITLCGTMLLVSSYSGLFMEFIPKNVIPAAAGWLGGSAVIIVLAKKNDDWGIGNGVSLVLAANILSRILPALKNLYDEKIAGKEAAVMGKDIFFVLLALFAAYFITMYFQKGVLEVPVRPTRKPAASYSPDGVLPVKASIANVMPVIFASAVISMPVLAATLCGLDWDTKAGKILLVFDQSSWWDTGDLYWLAGFGIYVFLLIFMGFYYSNYSFNSAEIAARMRQCGDVIPGISPGMEMELYLEKRRKVMTGVCVAFLLVLSIAPDFACAVKEISTLPFLGTSLVIIVNVLFDTAARLRATCMPLSTKFALFREGGFL